MVFRGIDGQLPPDLLKQGFAPEFFSRGGEVRPVPESLVEAVKAVTAGVSCVNCRHCHGLRGKGDGPLAPKNPRPADLTDATWDHGASDGEIYTLILNVSSLQNS